MKPYLPSAPLSDHVPTTRPRTFSLTGLLRLVRVGNLLIVVLTQYAAGLYLVDRVDTPGRHLLDPALFGIVLSTVLLAAAGYAINDYYDVKVDLINRPARVVVDRILKRRVALGLHFLMLFAGLAVGFWVSPRVGLFNLTAAFLLWLYSNRLKRRPLVGNVVMALLTAATLWVLAVHYRRGEVLLGVFATYAFFLTLIREVLKDMADVRGDARHGSRTLPIVWGLRRTKYLLYALTALFITVLFPLTGLLPDQRIGFVYLLLLVPLSWLIVRLVRADTTREFGRLSLLCKWIMLAGALSMVLL
ncbi:MAG: geranylgeranylglycerol-phosphate geranylgeranyltransferase [Catalinimonas sp.]